MTAELISKKTRAEFREYFVSTTLREIEQEFDAANIPKSSDCNWSGSGQRRGLVEAYYASLDFTSWRDITKVLMVYGAVLSRLEDQVANTFSVDWAKRTFDSLKKWLERDGFAYANGKVVALRNNLQVLEVQEAARSLDAPELHRQLERLKASVTDDPALAIGTAKELVETVCKTILQERNIPFEADADVIGLVKDARKVLGLLPDDVPAAAKGADTIKRLLSNLGSIAQGLGELRNLYGTGHGRQGNTKGLAARHAQLAVGCAATLVTFLLQTHDEKSRVGNGANAQQGHAAGRPKAAGG
jgi:virulence-associated protein VapD